MHSKNPTDYWRYWKKQRKRTYNNHHIELNTFSDYYKLNAVPMQNEDFDYIFMGKLSNIIDRWDPSDELTTNKILADTMNAPVTEEEVLVAIRKSKPGKASGPDMIPIEFYKHGGQTVKNSILAVFNFVFQSGNFSKAWADGIINLSMNLEKLQNRTIIEKAHSFHRSGSYLNL